MNKLVGKIGASITGLSVLAFALSMIVGLFTPTVFYSCLISIFIAVGFIPFMVAVFSLNRDEDRRAVGMSGMIFAGIYAVIIFLVYFAQCTTVRMNGALSQEALSIISYGHVGSLFFNYDLLGYGFMGLSTFLIGFTVKPINKAAKAFRTMLWIHGVFFIPCLVIPMLPVFTAGGSDLIGTILLEVWCAYFLPICILGYKYLEGVRD